VVLNTGLSVQFVSQEEYPDLEFKEITCTSFVCFSETVLIFLSDMPMNCLPCLKSIKGDQTITYCQSGAIAKYLARKFGKK
jgi:hypothetical protein